MSGTDANFKTAVGNEKDVSVNFISAASLAVDSISFVGSVAEDIFTPETVGGFFFGTDDVNKTCQTVSENGLGTESQSEEIDKIFKSVGIAGLDFIDTVNSVIRLIDIAESFGSAKGIADLSENTYKNADMVDLNADTAISKQCEIVTLDKLGNIILDTAQKTDNIRSFTSFYEKNLKDGNVNVSGAITTAAGMFDNIDMIGKTPDSFEYAQTELNNNLLQGMMPFDDSFALFIKRINENEGASKEFLHMIGLLDSLLSDFHKMYDGFNADNSNVKTTNGSIFNVSADFFNESGISKFITGFRSMIISAVEDVIDLLPSLKNITRASFNEVFDTGISLASKYNSSENLTAFYGKYPYGEEKNMSKTSLKDLHSVFLAANNIYTDNDISNDKSDITDIINSISGESSCLESKQQTVYITVNSSPQINCETDIDGYLNSLADKISYAIQSTAVGAY